MNQIREKSETDLAWDEIRRTAEANIRLASAHAVARLKNKTVPQLKKQFDVAVSGGRIPLLGTPEVEELLESAYREVVRALPAGR